VATTKITASAERQLRASRRAGRASSEPVGEGIGPAPTSAFVGTTTVIESGPNGSSARAFA